MAFSQPLSGSDPNYLLSRAVSFVGEACKMTVEYLLECWKLFHLGRMHPGAPRTKGHPCPAIGLQRGQQVRRRTWWKGCGLASKRRSTHATTPRNGPVLGHFKHPTNGMHRLEERMQEEVETAECQRLLQNFPLPPADCWCYHDKPLVDSELPFQPWIFGWWKTDQSTLDPHKVAKLKTTFFHKIPEKYQSMFP